MDYFYWDEIFGGRQGLAPTLFDDFDEDDAEPTPDLVSVVIVWSEDSRRAKGFQGP